MVGCVIEHESGVEPPAVPVVAEQNNIGSSIFVFGPGLAVPKQGRLDITEEKSIYRASFGVVRFVSAGNLRSPFEVIPLTD